MKTIYIAEDGTPFENRSDCESHELKLKTKQMKNQIFGWNADHEPIDYTSETFMESIFYLVCLTDEAADAFIERNMVDGYGAYGVDGAGTFYWDEEHSEWRHAYNFVQKYEKEINFLEEIMSKTKDKDLC